MDTHNHGHDRRGNATSETSHPSSQKTSEQAVGQALSAIQHFYHGTYTEFYFETTLTPAQHDEFWKLVEGDIDPDLHDWALDTLRLEWNADTGAFSMTMPTRIRTRVAWRIQKVALDKIKKGTGTSSGTTAASNLDIAPTGQYLNYLNGGEQQGDGALEYKSTTILIFEVAQVVCIKIPWVSPGRCVAGRGEASYRIIRAIITTKIDIALTDWTIFRNEDGELVNGFLKLWMVDVCPPDALDPRSLDNYPIWISHAQLREILEGEAEQGKKDQARASAPPPKMDTGNIVPWVEPSYFIGSTTSERSKAEAQAHGRS